MPVDPRALDATLQGLEARLQATDDDVGTALQTVVDAAVGLLRCSGTGLMLVDDEQVLRYVAASDEAGRLLETAQAEVGEGPCVDAFVDGQVVATDDLTTDGRWARLAPLVAPSPVRAVLGAPVRVGPAAVGSLDAYVEVPTAWDESEVAAIVGFTGVLEGFLGTALLAHRSGGVVDQLEHALEHRVVIERAVGLLMGRQGLSASEAFEELRRAARRSRGKVADLAARLLEGSPLP